MEEESKISFLKKIKTSIFGLEEYQKLAVQKVGKTISYIAIIMLIFAFFVTLVITYRFHQVINEVSKYINENIETITFQNGILSIEPKDKPNEAVLIEEENVFKGKIIIDTKELSQEQISDYTEDIKGYENGILVLKDKMIFKTFGVNITTHISFAELAEQMHIVHLEKQDILEFTSDNMIYKLDIAFFIALLIIMYINYLAAILLDVILYSIISYIVGTITRLRLKYSAAYNIAAYSLTLPILLNLIYIIVNILTGYTIKYFSIMYMAITCIYIFTAILMIKSDMIKKQIELSKIIEEQERIKQEITRKELEKQEEVEKEKIRKEDEKKRQEEKKRKKEKETTNKKPEPQANITMTNE